MDEQPQMPQIPDPRFLLPRNHPLVLKRLEVCKACPLSGFTGNPLSAIFHGLIGASALTCSQCHCFIFLKTRVVNAGPLSRCPKGFW